LLEIEGVFPAPYMARIFWVAIERYDVFSARELQQLLRDARQITFNKLTRQTRDILALPASQQKKLVVAARIKRLKSRKKSR